MIVAVVEQKVIVPYRQVDDFDTAPYVYATLLSSDQTLMFNPETGKFEIKTVSVLGHTHSQYSLTSHTHSQYSLTSHVHTFDSLTSKPTTIGGYGITDAYTKNQVDTLLGEVTIDAYTKGEVNNFFAGTVAITGYNKSDWDIAYGWGDHASAGYATSSHNHDLIYLKLTGGTLTGGLTGTSGSFDTLSAATSFTLNNRTLTIRTL